MAANEHEQPERDRARTDAGTSRLVRRRLFLLALGLLAAAVVIDGAAGLALRPPYRAHRDAEVLATPGVAAMIHDANDAPVDPTEIAQVAAHQHRSAPLALPAQALIDSLLLVTALGLGAPHIVPNRDVTSTARLGSFIGSLAVLLASVAGVVVAVARLRYLVALYLSPPFGTLSYLLLYGSFRRGGSLGAVVVLMALKVGACSAFFQAYPRATSARGLAGLALTAVAATVVTTFAYALSPTGLASITDAMAAALVALAAVLWAGVVVSGSVRRLA
ncbi:MAG: hypothetical protein M3083_00320 [Actinomycetota bacterium]|nr:hypothetical protein [Actinomycetota bacterium]MDQ6949725.1 hypothetical protein [Actinomycetota bacterium]